MWPGVGVKCCPNVSKSCLNNIHDSFYINLSIANYQESEFTNLFGILLKAYFCQELSKIAKSCHTGQLNASWSTYDKAFSSLALQNMSSLDTRYLQPAT